MRQFPPGDTETSSQAARPRLERRLLSRRRRMARRTVAVLPTLFTLGNLLAGFAAIFIASRQADAQLPFGWTPVMFAAVCIFIGMVFDGLDGRIARLTRSSSELGEQLDSMADMVTFGVAPAFVAIQLVGVGVPFMSETVAGDRLFDRIALVAGCIYVVCAALRLARFNVELEADTESDHNSFRGLPSPGAAGTVASVVLLHQYFLAREASDHWTVNLAAFGMVGLMLLVSFAMVSNVRYVHVMNRWVRGRAKVSTLAKAIIVALLLVVHWQGALAAAFALYAISAPAASLYRRVFDTEPPIIGATGGGHAAGHAQDD
ncbi:phosphatidylcholine/phosphatidylserine synthase [Phycisphaerales bacterium AB-hyl4]|uniref:Phosphatidylcholine/phosphatidylserine synthase n=1 Tax=Natronomicrosphaera hydrolytica TaxID=3242702 RepID=A0ABV4U5Z6_9BACT